MKKGLEDKVDKVSLSSRVQSFEEVNRELTKVNDTLNALLEKTTQTSEVDTTEGTEGNPGDIKTILNSDKTYSFSIRTEDGWKTPFLENREIIFKSKNPSAGEIKKSIDEIESKSTNEAKKTIFDEKADKFIMPRADFDSGWQTWTRTSHDGSGDTPLKIEHGLEVLPTMIIGYFAPGQSADGVTFFTPIKNDRGYGYDNGIGLFVDNTRVYFYGGDANSLVAIPTPSATSNCGGQVWDDGCVRVLVWK